ncbi:MAG TPA: hypothetical protein VGC91_08625 [Pyrinomonadaceae bacterium]|jgi:hypothetical protein
MKTIRALMLVLALSVCAYADGNMPNEKTGNMPNERAGIMPNEKTSAVDPVTDIALQLLQSVLPLF